MSKSKQEISIRSVDYIHVSILVVILCCKCANCYQWERLGGVYKGFSALFLIILCDSTIISIRISMKKDTDICIIQHHLKNKLLSTCFFKNAYHSNLNLSVYFQVEANNGFLLGYPLHYYSVPWMMLHLFSSHHLMASMNAETLLVLFMYQSISCALMFIKYLITFYVTMI